MAATLLWHLRVLGGWVPRQGTDLVRTFAAGFEVANVDEHLHALAGGRAAPPFRLGTLATAWPRLARTTSVADVRATRTTSGWGDPGGDTPAAVRVGMRLAWMSRVAIAVPPAEAWAAGAAALLVARETHVGGRPLTDQQRVSAEPLLRSGWSGTHSLPDFAAALPPSARWAVAGLERPEELWQAEAAWWRRVEHDGFVLLRRGGFSGTPVIGAVGVLAAEAWRVDPSPRDRSPPGAARARRAGARRRRTAALGIRPRGRHPTAPGGDTMIERILVAPTTRRVGSRPCGRPSRSPPRRAHACSPFTSWWTASWSES